MELLKEYVRMCIDRGSCENCPLGKLTGKFFDACPQWIFEHYDEAVKRIAEWAKEHPRKTYAQDFFEKFPNAEKGAKGEPWVCWEDVYGTECPNKNLTHHVSCTECWNRSIEERPMKIKSMK